MNLPKRRPTARIELEPAQRWQLESLQRRQFLRGSLTVGACRVRWFQMCRPLLFKPRHGQRLAPTDIVGPGLR